MPRTRSFLFASFSSTLLSRASRLPPSLLLLFQLPAELSYSRSQMFTGEALGLQALGAADALAVPKVSLRAACDEHACEAAVQARCSTD